VEKKRKKKIIGRREYVDFPQLGLEGIEAKVDTGAYTTSIHCEDIKHFEQNGVPYVSFVLLDESHSQYHGHTYMWALYKTKQVKNSFGHTEERYSILTQIRLYDEVYNVELSLADRSQMDFPVLLGRKALNKRFLVDVSKIHCAVKKKKKTK
jgi:hypothetical protein